MGAIKQGRANSIVTSGKLDATKLTGTISSTNIVDASLNSVTTLPSAVGDFVESVANDPGSPSEGQVWYNSTVKKIKYYTGALVKTLS